MTVPTKTKPIISPPSSQQNKEEPLTAIQSTTQHIVKLTPPRKVPLPHHILENEPHHEPTTIVDPRRWRYPTHTVQNNRRAHPLDPRVRVLAAPDPEGYGEEDTDDDSVEVPVVDGADAELACWADETPIGRRGVSDAIQNEYHG